MSFSYNMPEPPKSTGTRIKELYRPLPFGCKQKHTNQLFVGLFRPSQWQMFKRDGRVVGIPDDLTTFHFMLPTHRVDNFPRPDGSFGSTSVVCPAKLTYYLSQLGMVSNWVCEPLFENPRCPFCEKAKQWWDVYETEKVKAGYSADKYLTRDEAQHLRNINPIAKEANRTARKWGASNRYILQVFDHDKFEGRRTPGEGEDATMAFQLWLAPKTVYEQLKNQFDIGYHFFDTTNPEGVFIIQATKDTMNCPSDKNLLNTEYHLGVGPVRHQYTPEVLNYLNNWDARVDPSPFVPMVSYEELLHYVGNDNMPVSPTVSQVVPSSNVQAPTMTPGMPSVPNIPQTTPNVPQTVPVTPSTTNGVPSVPVNNTPQPSMPTQQNIPVSQPVATPQQPTPAPQPAVNPEGPPIPVQPSPAQSSPSPQPVGQPQPVAPATVVPAIREVPDRTPPAQQSGVPDAPPAGVPEVKPENPAGPAPGKRDYTNPPAEGGGSPTKMAW